MEKNNVSIKLLVHTNTLTPNSARHRSSLTLSSPFNIVGGQTSKSSFVKTMIDSERRRSDKLDGNPKTKEIEAEELLFLPSVRSHKVSAASL